MEERNQKRQIESQIKIDRIKKENELILKNMKKNSDNKIKNTRLQKQIDIEKINEESINKLILN